MTKSPADSKPYMTPVSLLTDAKQALPVGLVYPEQDPPVVASLPLSSSATVPSLTCAIASLRALQGSLKGRWPAI